MYCCRWRQAITNDCERSGRRPHFYVRIDCHVQDEEAGYRARCREGFVQGADTIRASVDTTVGKLDSEVVSLLGERLCKNSLITLRKQQVTILGLHFLYRIDVFNMLQAGAE